MPDLRLGNAVFQLRSRRISRRWTRSGTNLVIFFRSPLHANQFILARNEDTICILKSNTGQENFRTVARHNKCSFLQVRKESGSPV